MKPNFDPRELVDLEGGRLSPEVYYDEEIYRQELESVFGRSWLFLGHECQLPDPGSFFTAYMGTDPVIVNRRKDGSLGCMLNACRHRGMRVTCEDAGRSHAFTCRYHGWSYDGAGALTARAEEYIYGDDLPKEDWSLGQVAQLDTYQGLIFATFDADAPSLEDYLGDMKWYLDAAFGRLPEGCELIGGVQKWRIKANWKFGADQFVHDNYHVFTTHITPYAVLSDEPLGDFTAEGLEGGQFSSPYGHGMGWFLADEGGLDDAVLPPIVAEYFHDVAERVDDHIGETRRRFECHATVFPNLSFLSVDFPTMRVWHPKGPHEMEVWSWAYVDASAPQDVKDELRRLTTLTFGAAGIFEQDDGDNWAIIQHNLESPQMRRQWLNIQMGHGKEPDPHPEAPGQTTSVGLSEMALHGYYRRWAELLTHDTADHPIPPGIQ